ncbi:hypothetical protein ABB05_16075 [Lederbergia galactosidilytica]|uniref:Uncharacterized protein n=2 Tax=Lederbergia galactosidilytica TaxID=217031 RepID=A0A177ZJG8_9BACI|nr:hypothetical protein ABB05_16075 [Lederbergia galactosidilytica]
MDGDNNEGKECHMKKLSLILISYLILLLLVGCSNDSNEIVTSDASNNGADLDSKEEETSGTDERTSIGETEAVDLDHRNETSVEEEKATPNEEDPLSAYSAEEIEYARVWLQLGPNQEVEELNVYHFPAGEVLNPDDETSANYPEDVIQLAGARLVDGSVTYSGNGDGTINVYNVPLRWDGQYPAGEEFYTNIINNTELVAIDPNDDNKIRALIKLLNFQS